MRSLGSCSSVLWRTAWTSLCMVTAMTSALVRQQGRRRIGRLLSARVRSPSRSPRQSCERTFRLRYCPSHPRSQLSPSERMGLMTEEDARMALLQTELAGLQSAIQNLDRIIFQIKGWCVTTALAIGGFAVAYHKPALLIVGFGAIIGFYFINCQVGMIQRSFITRNHQLDFHLKNVGIMQFLKGAGNLDIAGTSLTAFEDRKFSYGQKVRYRLPYL